MTAGKEKRIQRAEILIAGIFFSAIQLSTQRVETEAVRATTLFVTSPETSSAVSAAGTVTPCACLLLNVSIAGKFRKPASYCMRHKKRLVWHTLPQAICQRLEPSFDRPFYISALLTSSHIRL